MKPKNTPIQNIEKTLKGKRILFLENDISLNNGLDKFEQILKDAGIEYTILFNLSELPIQTITDAINSHDAIVFMTQWLYEISHTLFDYVKALKKKKIIIEVYISNPTWYYKSQHGSKHDVYIYSYSEWSRKRDHSFHKLTNKPYWDYKNEFDK
jgi:hypothetical protein